MDVHGFSPYLLAVAAAWLIAQLMKYLLDAVKSKSLSNLSLMYQSGSMPSVHSAVMTAVTTTIGILDGVSSGLFALAVVLSVVVMYDAMQVRRAVGEQGLALRELLERAKIAKSSHHALGHKPLEVAVGAALGITVAFFITTFF
jgi:uncharacterized protein